ANLAEPSRQAEQPHEQQHAPGDERDVLSGDGEQVIEARGAEALPELVREALVVSEHDALENRASLARHSPSDRGSQPRSQPVADPADAAAAADDAPAVAAQHD